MKPLSALLGFVLFVVGAVLLAFAYNRPTTVGSVHNIGLLVDRVCLVIIGAAAFVCSAIYFAIAAEK